MEKRLTMFFACLFLSVGMALAQTKVTGTVISQEDGQPIIGAAVKVVGTSQGMLTDVNGRFSLTLPAGKTDLQVTYLGYEGKTVKAKNGMRIFLQSDAKALDDVLVVAYGKTSKQAFTGSATQLDGEAMSMKNTSEITKTLQGEVAGVQVFNTSGQPGSNATVLIRGLGSINSSSAPLYVVDGMQFSGDISGLNPGDIESMTVLKGPSATSLYGSRAANGVILVTTKSGKRGELKIEAEIKAGANARWIPQYNTIKSPERFTELTWEGMKNMFRDVYGFGDQAGLYANAYLFDGGRYGIDNMYNMWDVDGDQLIDPETGSFYEGINRKYTPENWDDHIFRTGLKLESDVKISGGNDRINFFTSLGFLKDEGYYLKSDFKRFNARANVSAELTSWLRSSMHMSYSNMTYNQPGQEDISNNGFQFVNYMPPLFPVYERDAEGNLIEDTRVGGWRYDYGMGLGYGRAYASGINPAGAIKLDKNKTRSHQFIGDLSLEARFLKDFKFTVNLGMQYLGSNNDDLTNPYYGDAEGIGRIEKTSSSMISVQSTQMLSWGKQFGKHALDAFIAHESSWYQYQYMTGQKSNILRGDNLEWSNAVIMGYMDSDKYKRSLESFFGQLNYNYDQRYYFTAALRFDGSSRFSSGNKWGTFGSLGFGWVITNEKFMKNVKWLKFLKLKADWGLLGNQSLSTGSSAANYYPYYDLFAISNMNDNPSVQFYYKGNNKLTWEKTSSFNFGFDFNIANVLEGEFEYFNNTTRDMLYMKQVAPSLGYASYPVNDGKIRNAGIEFALKWHAIRKSNLKFDVRFNASRYTNKMIQMPIDDTTGQPKPIEVRGAYAWSEGHSIYDYYMREYAGVDPDNGHALYNQYYNVKADGTRDLITDMELYKQDNVIEKLEVEKTDDYSNATRKYVDESAVPSLTGGFGFDLAWKGFEVNATFTYGLGGKAYDNVYATLMRDNSPGEYNWHTDIEKRWQNPGDITDVPGLFSGSNGSYSTYAAGTSTRFLTSRSYLNFTNLRIGYTFPKKWFVNKAVKKLQVYVTAENLFVISARKGFVSMSSVSGASDRSAYLPVSTIMGGVKVEF